MIDLRNLKESGSLKGNESPPIINVSFQSTPMMDAVELLEDIGKLFDELLDPSNHKQIGHWEWGRMCRLDVEISQLMRRLKV